MIPQIWLGTEHSFQNYLFSLYQFGDKLAQLKGAFEFDDPVESIMDKHGDVGIISIDGPLVDSPDMMDRFFGVTGYSDVTEAINRHLEDKGVKSLVLSLNTPGGDASGIGEVSSFIAEAKQIKPVHSWTGKSALSAGYWIGSSGSSFHASKMAETGSIGAIATYTSIARRLKDEGIDVHVERGGKQKALLHPAEELSEEGKKLLKAKVGQLHDFFLEHVTSERPQLRLSEKSQWGEGQTFFTKESIEKGLLDGPAMTLGELVASLQSKKQSKSASHSSNSSHSSNFGNSSNFGRSTNQLKSSTLSGKMTGAHNHGTNDMTKQVLLSEKAQAQLASGVPIEEIDKNELMASSEESVESEAPTETEVKTEEVAAEGTVAETKVEDTTTGKSVESYLKEQLKERETELMELRVQKSQMETQLNALKDVESTLQPIAIEAINRMQIALGQSPSTLKGLPAASLAEQYGALKEDFNKRFKSGQLSQGATDDSRQGRSLEELRLMSSVKSK